MWIEINYCGKQHLINSDSIEAINRYPHENYLEIAFFSPASLVLNFNDQKETAAYYEGFVLALNGLDFICDATDTFPAGFIKPLLQSKNEALYRHLMLKDALNERG